MTTPRDPRLPLAADAAALDGLVTSQLRRLVVGRAFALLHAQAGVAWRAAAHAVAALELNPQFATGTRVPVGARAGASTPADDRTPAPAHPLEELTDTDVEIDALIGVPGALIHALEYEPELDTALRFLWLRQSLAELFAGVSVLDEGEETST